MRLASLSKGLRGTIRGFWSNQREPMLKARNIHYEAGERSRGINCGGIGAIHTMVNRIGLREDIDAGLHLLKRHLPYHESDHVLNIAYNSLLDGMRLQDIELRRNDEAFLDAPGTGRRRSSGWPTGVATRRTSSNSSRTASTPCACRWTT